MIKLYKDSEANAIFIENSNGVQFVNSLHATLDAPTDVVVTIQDTSREVEILTEVPFEDFVDKDGVSYGATCSAVCDALNAVFSASGSSTGVAPVITSSTTVNMTQGDTLNYELTSTDGVGYEWSNLPSGVVNVEGNLR